MGITINQDSYFLDKELALTKNEYTKDKIGLMKEHTLHRVLKFYLSNDESFHEVQIKKRFADVYKDEMIYEIQTKSFNLLRDKFEAFFPDYEVTVVYPIIQNKEIYVENINGEIEKKFKSPKHQKLVDSFKELYRISSYLDNPKLHFMFLFVDAKEYRTTDVKTKRCRKGFERYDQIPLKINKVLKLDHLSDFKEFMSDDVFKKPFTSTEFSKFFHINKKASSVALNVLYKANAVKRIGKLSKSYLYILV